MSGTVEAVVQALQQLKNKEIHFRVLHSGVGEVTDADVSLAAASKGPSPYPAPKPYVCRARSTFAPNLFVVDADVRGAR